MSRDRTSNNASYVYPQPAPNADAYASNGLNQIATLDGAGLTYDARGNLTSAGAVSYSYDAYNRLTVAGPMSLAYDPAGRLYETSASGTTTRFLYSGLQAIGEYNSSGTLLRRYVPGAGLDEHLVWYEGAGTSDRRWIVQDERGSVAASTDGSGAALAINSYDEYGMPAAGNSGLFGYTGQMYLSAAGLYHYRARAYSPSLGRFLQTDPIGYAGGLNLYAYVGNDPINFTDALGLQTVEEPFVVEGDPCLRANVTCVGGDSLGYYLRGANVGEFFPVRLPREPRGPREPRQEEDEGRELNRCERRTLSGRVPQDAIDAARIHGQLPFWLPDSFGGITIGADIYFRPGAYDPATVAGLGLLSEEVGHVSQYLATGDLGGWLADYASASADAFLSGGDAYLDNPYESVAQDVRQQLEDDLRENGGTNGCPPDAPG